MGLQLSRLERPPDKREVDGSSPFKPTIFYYNVVANAWVYKNTTLRITPSYNKKQIKGIKIEIGFQYLSNSLSIEI